MKFYYLLFLFLISCGATPNVQEQPQTPPNQSEKVIDVSKQVSWHLFSDKLIHLARAENKKIFIYLYSSSCAHCLKMEQSTLSNVFVINALEKDFISSKIDVTTHPSAEIFYKNENGVMLVPKMVFVNPKTEGTWEVASWIGYVNSYEMLSVLESVNEAFAKNKGASQPESVHP